MFLNCRVSLKFKSPKFAKKGEFVSAIEIFEHINSILFNTGRGLRISQNFDRLRSRSFDLVHFQPFAIIKPTSF